MNLAGNRDDPLNQKKVEGTDQSNGRNLAFEFEKLYVKDKSGIETTPTGKCDSKASKDGDSSSSSDSDNVNAISPTCVIEESKFTKRKNMNVENQKDSEGANGLPYFYCHPDLKRELTQPQIDRISVYSVIHDINKEALEMSSHDNPETEIDLNSAAVIDEEKWLLAVIASRPAGEMLYKPCPATFAESIGEEERALAGEVSQGTLPNGMTPNPLSLLSVNRTQLWKPSRSWWEARSGRNPWIDPKSHNKRWRYLWPLIHYHKFIARCIKKLKRNGVDVKTSYSPVSVFLRNEVCSVSDHLGMVSKFSAEEWLKVLFHFDGWTNVNSNCEIEKLRSVISQLELKGLSEHSDVQSPLLRDQIDEQFLRAMQNARSQTSNDAKEKNKMRNNYSTQPLSTISDPGNVYSFLNIVEERNKKNAYRRNAKIRNENEGSQRNHMPPPSSYTGQDPYFQDPYHNNMPPVHYMPHYYGPNDPQQNNLYYYPYGGVPYPVPQMQYQQQNQDYHRNENPYYSYGSPSFSRHQDYAEIDDYSVTSTFTGTTTCSVSSPYWSHLDPLAMTGIASPAPQGDHLDKKHHRYKKIRNKNKGVSCAKPLLIHPHAPYQQRQHGPGYVPPSPASQFYNTLSPYHYGIDPRSSQLNCQTEAFQPPESTSSDVQTPLRNNESDEIEKHL